MAGFVNQIVAMVRFSYVSLNSFSGMEPDMTVAETTARLYDRARLKRRFFLFENLTLPALLAQRDAPKFTTVILTGKRMPLWAVERLQKAVAPLAGAVIVPLPPKRHYAATQEAFAAVRAPDATHLTSVRMDDDDALDRDHIARIARWADILHHARGNDAPFVTASNRGFFLLLDPAGNRVVEVVEKLPLGSGPAMTAPIEGGENIFRRNHRLLTQYYTTYMDVDVPAFIRTVHDDNDGAPMASGQTLLTPPDEIATSLAAHFPFTHEGMMALRGPHAG